MDLHVLYDRSGKILAAVRLDSEPGTVSPRPVARAGQSTADLKLPASFSHLNFLQVCTQLVVEGRGDRTTLAMRSAGKQRPRADRKRPKSGR
jgi:hypothetical protein